MARAAVPDISVLMPARDAAGTIDEALASVRGSEGVSLEVVVVEHGSRDDTARCVQSHGDARVRLVPTGRSVPFADALNRGVQACRAPLIARMDADDVMDPHRLRDDVAHAQGAPALAAVACQVALFGGRGDQGRGMARYVAWQNAVCAADDIRREMWIEQPLCHPATTFRRAALDAVGGYRHGLWPEDYDLFFRLWLAGLGIEKRAKVQHHWREHPGQTTWTSPRQSRDALCCLKVAAMIARYRIRSRPVLVVGAGKEGGRVGRVLRAAGVDPVAYFDVDLRRVGRERHGARVHHVDGLAEVARAHPGRFVIGAVGQSGARAVVRAQLSAAGLVEGTDAVVVA